MSIFDGIVVRKGLNNRWGKVLPVWGELLFDDTCCDGVNHVPDLDRLWSGPPQPPGEGFEGQDETRAGSSRRFLRSRTCVRWWWKKTWVVYCCLVGHVSICLTSKRSDGRERGREPVPMRMWARVAKFIRVRMDLHTHILYILSANLHYMYLWTIMQTWSLLSNQEFFCLLPLLHY